ncbi:MAG: ubiquinone biosynthesis hydroxylase [Methylobacteriaceae bacterium]|nr:ubiquinone biosynthesis hydroxylase [Methylobacteriaceae bacterium]
MTATPPVSDVIIAGGGLAGLSLAVALKHEVDFISVAVCDPGFGHRQPGTRASAIAAGPRRMFERLGVWSEVEPKAQAILDMVITDSRVADPVRPALLGFAGDLEPGEPFAHMVFNDDLTLALETAARRSGVEIIAAAAATYVPSADAVWIELSNEERRDARLLVAADGARSRLREQARIGMVGWDYSQSGIVATLAHERDHEGRAEEHFLPAGPFATLPLPGRRSSIVWTERHEEAARLVALDRDSFMAELELRFGHKLGALTLIDQPRAFRLGLHVARSFVTDRLALLGDAAHIIHPIAGQGLNLGLRDAAALAECIADHMHLGLDPGAPEPLAAYQRARRFDTVAMAASTDALNRLFSNDVLPVRLVRDFGLGLVDRLPGAKRFFMREAAGIVGATPRLMRGGISDPLPDAI